MKEYLKNETAFYDAKSKKTGVQPSTICEWNKNTTNPSSDTIMSIYEESYDTPECLLLGYVEAFAFKGFRR